MPFPQSNRARVASWPPLASLALFLLLFLGPDAALPAWPQRLWWLLFALLGPCGFFASRWLGPARLASQVALGLAVGAAHPFLMVNLLGSHAFAGGVAGVHPAIPPGWCAVLLLGLCLTEVACGRRELLLRRRAAANGLAVALLSLVFDPGLIAAGLLRIPGEAASPWPSGFSPGFPAAAFLLGYVQEHLRQNWTNLGRSEGARFGRAFLLLLLVPQAYVLLRLATPVGLARPLWTAPLLAGELALVALRVALVAAAYRLVASRALARWGSTATPDEPVRPQRQATARRRM